jgi:hypothetical protein
MAARNGHSSGVPMTREHSLGSIDWGRPHATIRLGIELDSTLDHYAVRYLALPADQAAPAYLERGWTCLKTGPFRQVWECSG